MGEIMETLLILIFFFLRESYTLFIGQALFDSIRMPKIHHSALWTT